MSDVVLWVTTIALGVGLAACAGLRAWLPLLVAGCVSRLGLAPLGEGFQWLGSTPALVLFAVATAIEISADKIPALDHALDAISTIVRPAAGALVASAVLVQADDPMFASVLGLLIGAPVALAPHVAKASARAVSSTTTAGFGNPVLSVLEDVVAVALAVLAFLVPILVAVGLLVLGGAAWRWIARRRAGRQDRVGQGLA